MSEDNLVRVDKLLTLLFEAFSPYIERTLQQAYGADWQARVLKALPEFDRKDGDWRQDFRALFAIVLNNDFWKNVFGSSLRPDDRTRIRELLSTANKWAHKQGRSISTVVVYRTLDDVRELLGSIGAKNGVDPRVEIGLLRELLAEVERKVPGSPPPVSAEPSSIHARTSASAAGISKSSTDVHSVRRHRARRLGDDALPIASDPAREGSEKVDSARNENTALALARKLLQLEEAGRYRDPGVRSRAAEELAELGPSLVRANPSLAAELRAKDKKTRLEAATKALSSLKGAAVRALMEALEDSVLEVRKSAAEALREIGAWAYQAVPPLTALVDHADPHLSSVAAMALTEISRTAGPLIVILRSKNRDDPLWRQFDVRYYAIAALSRLLERDRSIRWDEESRGTVPALADAVEDDDAELRLIAVKVLGMIRGAPDATIPPLCSALGGDADRDVRWAAAIALGEHGEAAHLAVTELCAALADVDVQVRGATAVALGRIGPKAIDAVPALTDALNDPEVRQQAHYALAKIRAASAPPSPTPSVKVAPSIKLLGEGRQSFPHGRSKAVTVEKVTRRVPTPGDAGTGPPKHQSLSAEGEAPVTPDPPAPGRARPP